MKKSRSTENQTVAVLNQVNGGQYNSGEPCIFDEVTVCDKHIRAARYNFREQFPAEHACGEVCCEGILAAIDANHFRLQNGGKYQRINSNVGQWIEYGPKSAEFAPSKT